MGWGKVLSLLQFFRYCILFGGNSIGYVKEPLYSACSNLNHGKSKLWKVERQGDLSKILTISTTSLLLFGFSSYVVTNAGYYCAKITEGRNALKFHILKLLKGNCSNTALHQCGSSFSWIIEIWVPIKLKNNALLCWI